MKGHVSFAIAYISFVLLFLAPCDLFTAGGGGGGGGGGSPINLQFIVLIRYPVLYDTIYLAIQNIMLIGYNAILSRYKYGRPLWIQNMALYLWLSKF